MEYEDRERIVERLPFESRLGYVAYCAEQCFEEARRHPIASKQLDKLPMLTEALGMLWARAEKGVKPDLSRVKAIRAHFKEYSRPDPDGENEIFRYDITLVKAAAVLNRGMRLLEKPDSVDAYGVAAALEGPENAVSVIYVDWEHAGDAEANVIDTALKRLDKWGSKPFTRDVFAGIPDWKRGKVKPAYAEGRITGTDVNRED